MKLLTLFCVSLIYLIDSSVTACPCLTWKIKNNELNVLLKSNNLSYPISFTDPSGRKLAECDMNIGKVVCGSVYEDVNVTYQSSNNSTLLAITKIHNKAVTGKWICATGYFVKEVNISTTFGIYSATDMDFSGTVDYKLNITILTCSSCWDVYGNTVDILIDNKSYDSVRYHKFGCYNTIGSCYPDKCSCLLTGNGFTYKTGLPCIAQRFSCFARFMDEYKEIKFSIKKTLIYNGNDLELYSSEKFLTKTPSGEIDSLEKFLTKTPSGEIDEDQNSGNDNTVLQVACVSLIFLISVILRCILKRIKKKAGLIRLSEKKAGLIRLSEKKAGLIRLSEKNPGKNPDAAPLLYSNEIFGEGCHTCGQLSTCAICSDCRNEYCEICCNAHTKYYPEHSVCQVEHYFTSKTQVKCKSCTHETAGVVCTKCKKTLCSKCKEDHEKLPINHKMKKLYPESIRPRRRDESEYVTHELSCIYKISIKREENENSCRICGIGFLSDCRIVTVDNSNNKIVVYDEGGFQFAEKLSDEPRGLAQMTGERIALTFSYKMEIRIYLIEKNRAVEEQKITMKMLGLDNLKPFSISYNNDHLAIEVGEGDDGRIVIINIHGENITVQHTILNKNNFAYFTGNTIRMALDMKHRKIFISGMSKKIVSCIDFDGNIVWNQVIPSPRSLLFISKESSSGKNVICASRRCSVIFRLDENTGKDDCLLFKGNIRYPRYIAYHEGKSLLCVQVATDFKVDPFGEELLVFEYNTPLSDKNETEN